ncbi:hypothetical protein D3C79_1096830 [compost metagenome]
MADIHWASSSGGVAGFQVFSNNALLTTLTLDRAMAAPASTGLSMPKAARGIPIRL